MNKKIILAVLLSLIAVPAMNAVNQAFEVGKEFFKNEGAFMNAAYYPPTQGYIALGNVIGTTVITLLDQNGQVNQHFEDNISDGSRYTELGSPTPPVEGPSNQPVQITNISVNPDGTVRLTGTWGGVPVVYPNFRVQ